jgi:hypothetical protein
MQPLQFAALTWVIKMEFERYDCEVDNGYAYMQPSADGDYVPYQQAQAALEQLKQLERSAGKTLWACVYCGGVAA